MKQFYKFGWVAAMLSASCFFVGCSKKAEEKVADQKDLKPAPSSRMR